MRPIVITGAGVISAIGVGKEQTLKSLLAHKSGIEKVKYLQTDHKEMLVGEVKLSNAEMLDTLGLSPNTPHIRTALLGMIAAKEAIVQAGLDADDISNAAFISGTTVGGMDKSEQFYLDFMKQEIAGGENTKYIDYHDCGASSTIIADYCGKFAFVTSISTACSSAANAFILGASLIESGEYDKVVVGGAECLSKFHLNGFNSLMILDSEPCRPFDATRAGLNLGEGAAYLVLETEESAKNRGAKAIAYLKGCGNACDAFHQTASSENGEGAYLAMKEALETAKMQPSDIDYINSHGTGTPNNDPSECEAMRRLFGNAIPPFSSTKGFTGHTTSASGSIEAVFSLLALENQFLPVSLNWNNPIAEDCIPVTTDKEKPNKEINNILCNAFGFGGNDSSILLSKKL